MLQSQQETIENQRHCIRLFRSALRLMFSFQGLRHLFERFFDCLDTFVAGLASFRFIQQARGLLVQIDYNLAVPSQRSVA